MAATVVAVLGVGQSAIAGTPGPRVTDLSPSSGPATGGTSVTISGTDLSGATAVDFGPGNAASFTVNSATSVTATSPAGSGTVNVTVTTPAGTSMVQDLDWYTYAGPMDLNPTYDVVPADGSMRGAVTATLTTGGSPAANVAVTATEADPPSESVHSITGCTTGSDGTCVVYTDTDTTTGTGTMTLSAPGFGTETATLDFSTPGPTPTGLSVSVANGSGPSAALNAGDTFSDGHHYLLEESSGLAGNYEGTPSEAVLSAALVNGSGALTTGTEPYAVNWSVQNTGSNTLYVDAIANVAEMPNTNVICVLPAQTDPNVSLNCTPSSFDLDYNPHFSNPADPGEYGLGVNNGTMNPESGGVRTVGPGSSAVFTTYMIGQNNDAEVVLDSPSGQAVSATVQTQLASDPFGTLVEGSTVGGAQSVALSWVQPASGSTVSGILGAVDSAESSEPDNRDDWVVVTTAGTPELVNFDQTSGQSYSANGVAVNEATFEGDLGSGMYTTLSVTHYGQPSQANALSTAPVVIGVSPSSGPTGGATAVTITGTHLSGATAVSFGSTPATSFSVDSASSVTATAPAGTGTVDVTVTTPGGTSATSPGDRFTYVGTPPGVSGVSPSSGPTGGDTVVTITGTNLSGATAVSFGSTPATSFSVGSASSVTATAPAGTGTVDVTVTTASGTSATVSADRFTYLAPVVVLPTAPLPGPVVGIAATPDGGGYWLVNAAGAVSAHGDATFYGSMDGAALNAPIVHVIATADGGGYWLVAADGGVFSFGDAGFYGSTGSMRLNAPVVDLAPTPDGGGYWLVATDGGVFAFGDAAYHGSVPAVLPPGAHLAAPVNGISTAAGGYRLVAADGGVFSFGVPFYGSMGGQPLNHRVVGMQATGDGLGYWMVASDGGIFAFGDARFLGSTGAMTLSAPIVGMALDAGTGGYWLVGRDGAVFAFDAPFLGAD